MFNIITFFSKYNLNLIKIEDIQNISLFIISCSSFVSYLYYNLAPLIVGVGGGGGRGFYFFLSGFFFY